ncbi:unnamed protein product [Rotaria sordida]|uniref:HAT C-terminal dimerisation domain-containing protein n=1 Tax=Rotaria sordida TaxID=392033 RepID=A0A814GMY0_9BILA|nr:unnamed protein product [Rotaria sordida]
MISKEKGRVGIKANGLYEHMNDFNFFFGLKLGCLIFTNTEKLSRILQGSNCCLQDILCAAETIINYCSRIRVDIGKQMFSEYHKLIKLYLIIPVTTATAERTFNALN